MENGKMTNLMDKENNGMKMEAIIKVHLLKEKSMVIIASLNGEMERDIKVLLLME